MSMGTQLQPAQWSSVTAGKPTRAPALVPALFHDSDDEDPTQDHIPIDIYQHFGLPLGTPICLDSLEDPPPGVKPAYTYATLVKLAIWSSPQRKLTLSGIYEALERRFSWFRECENPSAWKTSIRHSLSLMAVFVKLPMDIHVPGKGCNWTVDFSKGDGYKRPRKRGPKAKRKTPVPEAELSTPTDDKLTYDYEPPLPEPPEFSNVNPETFQEAEDQQKNALPPYKNCTALAAAIPDPQFRHYRMRTYLYPNAGPLTPGSSGEVWERIDDEEREAIERSLVQPPPIRTNRTRNNRSSRRSDLIATNSRRSRKESHQSSSSQSPEEYFYPSPASYHAYHVASVSYHRKAYANSRNDESSAATKSSSECSPTDPLHGPNNDSARMRWRNATAHDFTRSESRGERCASESIIIEPVNSLGERFQSAPPPSESEFEEEDS